MKFPEFLKAEIQSIDKAICEIRSNEVNAGRNTVSTEAAIRIHNLRVQRLNCREALRAWERYAKLFTKEEE